MMGWYNDGTGWIGWLVMTLTMVAFWSLVIYAVMSIFRGTQRAGEPLSGQRDPMQILDERFARGEIDEDEYHARSSVLRAAAH